MKYIDLTHKFINDMPVYPGDPKSELKQTASIEKDGYTDSRIATNMHVGTHIDAPWHFVEGGKRISEYPPERFIAKGWLVDVQGNKFADVSSLNNLQIKQGDIVLFYSGFGKKYATPEYYVDYPEISSACAQKLVDQKVSMVGLDWPSPDRPPFATHKLLLGADVLLIENLVNLDQLLGMGDFRILAFPLRLDAEGSPARVVAEVL